MKNRYLSLFLLVFYLNNACIIYPSTECKRCLREMKVFVKKNWHFDTQSNEYKATPEFFAFFRQKSIDDRTFSSFIEYYDCLADFDRKKTQKLLGKPTEIGEKYLRYDFVYPPSNYHYSHQYAIIQFDEKGLLRYLLVWSKDEVSP